VLRLLLETEAPQWPARPKAAALLPRAVRVLAPLLESLDSRERRAAILALARLHIALPPARPHVLEAVQVRGGLAAL
jgi:hypothetical protein